MRSSLLVALAAAFTATLLARGARAQEPAPAKWYDVVKVGAFVDAYASVNYDFPKPQSGTNRFRAFDDTNGFALHWAGLDASVPAEPVGGTVSLRFGHGAVLFNGGDAAGGLLFVKQAFASWKPFGRDSKLTLDFGKFDQPYGSEVADSQYDLDYTRSFLYWLAQPLFFTGLRADYAFSDAVDLKLVAANGWNASIDDNRGKTLGAQLVLEPISTMCLSLGYVLGPEQPDYAPPAGDVPGANARWRHLADVIVDWSATSDLRLLFNADYGREDLGAITAQWYGANLATRYALDARWGVALRGEYFEDADGFTTGTRQATTLVGGTLTLSYAPTPNLRLMLDQRMDVATLADGSAAYAKGATGAARSMMTTTLGVIATTN